MLGLSSKTRDVCKTLCPLKLFFFVTDVLYNWISQFKISCTNVCRKKSFSKLLLNMVLAHLTLVTLTFDIMTPKPIGMCGPSLKKLG